MGETCPVCGRDVWPDGDLRPYGYERCWHRGGHECQGFAAGYQRGLAAAAPKWRPMESAPRDGTMFLLQATYPDGIVIEPASWMNGRFRWTDGLVMAASSVDAWMPLPPPCAEVPHE